MDIIHESQISQFLEKIFGDEKFSPKLPFAELKLIFSKFQAFFDERAIRIISIAGTNGKGETANTAHFLCQQYEIPSLMWTSPHILTVRERFQSQTGPIPAEEFCTQLAMAERELGDTIKCLSYYEFLFYVFCQWAVQKSPEVLILEVGVGGRLDAINVLNPSLCLLTSIGRDHTELLGKTYEAILLEKLGITRDGVPLLTTLRLNYCRELVQKYIYDRQILWMDWFNGIQNFGTWPYFRRNQLLAFAGIHLLKNSVIDAVNVSQEFRNFERKVTFPIFQARRELMTLGNKRFIFVGAHNVEGMRELAIILREDISDENGRVIAGGLGERENVRCVLASFSKRSPSEIYNMLDQLLSVPSIEKIVVSSFEHTKAYIRNELKALVMEYTEAQKRRATSVLKDCPGAGCIGKGTTIEWCENWQHWIEKENQNADVIVVGSYYFIGRVQEFISQIQ